MAKASRVLSETPTPHGYVIRRETWASLQAEVMPMTEGAGELADHLQGVIDSAPREMEMTTCYTNDGFWIGNEETARQLCQVLGIAPKPSAGVEAGELRPCCHGWCEKEQKWYGWSHRALYGFGIGSTVKRGDCAYVPVDMEDARQDAIRFWSEDDRLSVNAVETVDESGRPCFAVSWTYSETIPNKKLRGQISGVQHYPPNQFGRGEWTARNLEDARQMALDFAKSVS